MNEFLQDPLSEQVAEQLRAYIEQNKAEGLNHWLLGDGAFAPYALNQGGLFDWLPVFETEPMRQYEEMGLFVTPFPTDAQGLANLMLWLRQFDGKPMFSIVSSRASLAELKRVLTWLADAHTDDGLSVYLRIGDTRCLPYIMSSLQQPQREVVASYIQRWMWFDRDGQLSKGVASALKAPLKSAQVTLSQPLTINDSQYAVLVDGGEVDLIYSAIREVEDSFFPKNVTQQKDKYRLLEWAIKHAAKRGIKTPEKLHAFVIDFLIASFDRTKSNQ